ncbi:NAD(P)H-dependent glycerol-3-phosphate dehydrogenase [Oceanicella actignis]|uniref:Glycerol-3-phosphate dehydrogenase [NAD(P)+] n=1 Tax=Oceanicella actignis TaxID=1189325 RepID=A0A1M7S8E3_9RHOB|nr:NAD(P)H-dependent glycerol-3-phosphate dehydrogenase [Oceanicella actignis]TYO91652.1 glycerol-3-phosphate dehydrogenase (NAD(P)+) [Oceanicella actignis]SET32430.1 glycerol-3-phosphate dehydrogenase (NAD(P)+) [Oceanicella actignis]SHN54746.1 glycerol-3-phosphate dehydrogenase (NAD(P)+) [Oceanicella actignis]
MSRTDRPLRRIAVIGAGAWGTALAIAAARAGSEALLVPRSAEHARRIEAERRNEARLPGIVLPDAVHAEADPAAALAWADAAALATPSQAMRASCARLAPVCPPDLPLAICAKGVEAGSGLLMSEVVAEALPGRPLAALSGPSFADEVARDLPTAVVVAARSRALAESVARAFASARFRPYVSTDLLGVEIGGAAKNVVAIACGAAQGLGYGLNTRAALITRGLAEIRALGAAMGADPETLTGLSGLGDLTLTCSSEQSRNFAFGVALARAAAEGRAAAPAPGGPVVEGVVNARSVTALARRHGVEMPICEAVRAVVEGRESLDSAILALLARPLKAETAR